MSNALYTKSSNVTSEHDDIWDDSLLIKAYEESIKLQNEEVAKTIAMKTNKKQKPEKEPSEKESNNQNENNDFKVGSFVRSTFEDGIDYEAEILSINENGTANIKYIGYGNQQRVKVEDLIESWGIEAREEQKLLAEADNNPTEEEKNNQEEFHSFVVNKSTTIRDKLPIPPMPPMPPGMFDNSKDTEYMSAMLMSWYMSGYYTGLYHGRKEAKEEFSIIHQQRTTEIDNQLNENQKPDRKRQRKHNSSKSE